MNSISMNINADKHILDSLKEDITSEDLSTNSVIKTAQTGVAELICKQDGILAGMDVFFRVFTLLDSNIASEAFAKDGDAVKKGTVIAKIKGDIRVLLAGERTALNYLQRMSGIATYTNEIVQALAGTKVKLLDTRKTTPGMRVFEKYAVKIGGGHNHRFNLSDGILLKDNHVAVAGGVKNAVAMAREYSAYVHKIEVEVENMDMVREAVAAGADIIMLDNMTADTIKEAVAYINGRAEIECSGNITAENAKKYIELGVDYISCGALTHSAPILDFSLKNLHAV